MTYELLKFGHIAGAVLLGAGLIGVFMADLRSRQLRDLPLFAEAVRTIAVCYDGLVVPGAILLAGSGIWMIVTLYDGWAFFDTPWLAGMVLLFVFEFSRRHPYHRPAAPLPMDSSIGGQIARLTSLGQTR
ncbi:MAG: DUF2269 family protein [Rhodospirillales bacterium]|nr:DUF2269 family protein [Rhodospirillales bacterium]